jgi:hypothetical protein
MQNLQGEYWMSPTAWRSHSTEICTNTGIVPVMDVTAQIVQHLPRVNWDQLAQTSALQQVS